MMSDIGTTTEPARPTTGVPCSPCSSVSFSPPNIANRRVTDWGAIRADTVHITRRERFEYGYQAPCHLLIARVALAALRGDQQMTRRLVSVFEAFAPRDVDGVR